MNFKELDDLLSAVKDCFPDLRVETLRGAAARIDAGGGGRWEVGVAGGAGFAAIAARYFGGDRAYGDWLEAAAAPFGAFDAPPALSGPAAGFAWLSADWDLRSGEWTSVRLIGRSAAARQGRGPAGLILRRGSSGPDSLRVQAAPFRPAEFGEPALENALSDFSRLAPVSDRVTETVSGGAGRWSLRFRDGLAWSDFLRCDLSKAFTSSASQTSFLLRRLAVRELAFDEELLWAYCGG